AEIAGRFSRLAGTCVLAVLVTGGTNVWVQLGDLSGLWNTTYGRIFSGKLACVAGLLVLGALNRYVVLPRFSRGRSGAATQHLATVVASRFFRYVAAEVILAAVVLVCTAFLGQLPPPRHGTTHGNAEHSAARP